MNYSGAEAALDLANKISKQLSVVEPYSGPIPTPQWSTFSFSNSTYESASDDEPVIKASDIANTQNDRTLLISANQKAFQLSAENKRLKQLLAEKDVIVQKQANTLSAIQQELVKLGLQLPK